jgi:hypothetical protein
MDLKNSEEITLRAYQALLDNNQTPKTQQEFNVISQAHKIMDKLGITAYELDFKEQEK